MIVYHSSRQIVEYPEIRKGKYNKDFYFGFTVPGTKNKQKDGRRVMG